MSKLKYSSKPLDPQDEPDWQTKPDHRTRGGENKPKVNWTFSDSWNYIVMKVFAPLDEYLTKKVAEVIKLAIPTWVYLLIVVAFIVVMLIVL